MTLTPLTDAAPKVTAWFPNDWKPSPAVRLEFAESLEIKLAAAQAEISLLQSLLKVEQVKVNTLLDINDRHPTRLQRDF